jgi:uncharacterized protein YdhG (YjbR/CyaY superfamily)
MNRSKEVDAYIAGFPDEVRALLEQVRTTVETTAPEAREIMNYGIPTLTLEGNLVHFAGYKNHIGFYPAPSGIEAFREELSIYKSAKGSVQFPVSEPLPIELIIRIVQFRVNENLSKATAKQTKKKSADKPAKLTDKEQVAAHIAKLDPDIALVVQAVRKIILETDSLIGERIKWNNPAAYYTGDMKPFDPKEYKREIAVFNLHKGRVMVVFPSGAKVNDATGLLEGNFPDGRRIAIFKDLDDVASKAAALRGVIQTWIAMVE